MNLCYSSLSAQLAFPQQLFILQFRCSCFPVIEKEFICFAFITAIMHAFGTHSCIFDPKVDFKSMDFSELMHVSYQGKGSMRTSRQAFETAASHICFIRCTRKPGQAVLSKWILSANFPTVRTSYHLAIMTTMIESCRARMSSAIIMAWATLALTACLGLGAVYNLQMIQEEIPCLLRQVSSVYPSKQFGVPTFQNSQNNCPNNYNFITTNTMVMQQVGFPVCIMPFCSGRHF